jgi:hypothetical protein
MQQHQQQQQANFDLLAVFKEESSASAAETKLHKEGFGDDEVFRLPAGTAGRGEFREHGPSRERSEVFLQTKRTGPSPQLVVLFAVLFGGIFGVLTFGIVDFDLKNIALWPATLIGVLIGIVLGVIIGLTRKGRVRGAIGQDKLGGSKGQSIQASTPPPTPVNRPASKPAINAGALTVVALRLPDAENISRRSKARAILLNNGGKIDRSVGKS